MIDLRKNYRTRDGREVKLYNILPNQIYGVHGAVKDADSGAWVMIAWHNDGKMGTKDYNIDLIEVKPRHKLDVWVNMYRCYSSNRYYLTREKADRSACPDRIACVKVQLDFEEGEGL